MTGSNPALDALAEMEDRFESRLSELEEENEQLRERVDELEAENESLQERVDELPEISWDGSDIKTLTIGPHPTGKSLKRQSEKIHDIDDRVFDLERGEVDPGEIVAQGGPNVQELIPIHQMHLTAQNVDRQQHSLSPNQELAARCFPFVSEKADPSGGKLTLSSGQIRQVIERDVDSGELRQHMDCENPNNNTIRRVGQFLGKFGGDLFIWNSEQKVNRLECDRDDWVDYSQTVMDARADERGVSAGAPSTAGEDPTAATDGGENQGGR